MLLHLRRFILTALATLVVMPSVLLYAPQQAQAAASIYVGGPTSVTIGQTVNVTVSVNTGGQSANAFDATFSYPAALFDGVRGTYSGSICTLPISQPDPSGGTATISCGRPGGYSGTGLVATIVLKAKATGSGNFGLSGCSVLANDGLGTNITGGCSGKSFTVSSVADPTPTPTPGPTPVPTPTPEQKPKATPKPTSSPTPGGPSVPTDTANNPPANPDPAGPEVQELGEPTPTPEITIGEGGDGGDDDGGQPQTERRTIAGAVKDVFGSVRELGQLRGEMTGLVALLLTMIPFLALTFGIVLLIYRLYLLERRRRRTLDRLFELELAELAALEGKLDLLAEKGARGRQQFKEEFEAAKANILRQIKPDYARPVEPPKKVETPEAK
jgi:hypothetical protein